jgi:gas vesicle protein
MAEFADRMKSFTDHLRSSIQNRGEALSQVHEATEHLRDDARTFLSNVADEHRTRAEELHATLASHRKECNQKVSEMRQGHQDSLRTMRQDLQHMLSESRKARQDAVHELTETFQHTRHELADDLREASNAWHEFASRAAVKEMATEHRADAAPSKPTAPGHPGRHSHSKPAHGKSARARHQ